MKRFEPYARSALRIVAGAVFFCHGLQKVFGMFGGMGPGAAAAPFASLFWLAGAIETAGGLLLALGLFTRPAAFVLCGEMAFAYFHAHAPRGLWPIRNGGELAVLYAFVWLYFWAAGAGPWSLDKWLRKRA